MFRRWSLIFVPSRDATGSVVPVRELEIAPAAALDPQRNEDVLHRDTFVAQHHAIGRKRRGLLACKCHARGVIDQDPLVPTMLVVPDRVCALRMTALA